MIIESKTIIRDNAFGKIFFKVLNDSYFYINVTLLMSSKKNLSMKYQLSLKLNQRLFS